MRREPVAIVAVALSWCLALFVTLGAGPAHQRRVGEPGASAVHANVSMFAPSSECLACHNNLVTPFGEDVSIGASWRGSMMANSARDPYVLASVRKEIVDHPSRAREIEGECAACHLPAGQKIASAAGVAAQVFSHLRSRDSGDKLSIVARDGVTCTVCHQISPEGLGTGESFNGNFVVAPSIAGGARRAFGPFATDAGRRRIMRSVTGFEQEQSPHVQASELCATCHTLVTTAYGPRGEIIGSLPEQMNYQEWRHSAFSTEARTCQSCHMPPAPGPVRVSSVLGEERPQLSRHTFVGGNAFMLRLMNRFRDELGIEATPAELEANAQATTRQLQTDTAVVSIERAAIISGRLEVDVVVRNLTGHKLPTGYPSRRAWLHVTVRDAQGRAVFESGRIAATGLIEGNASDAIATAFEPHYDEITSADQVQIYESVLGAASGAPTTGLHEATQYLKDNRLLPRGFDKRTAPPDIAVRGAATADTDFTGDGDRVRYRVTAAEPMVVEAALVFQSIGYRWAQNLTSYDAVEPRAFVRYYDAVAASSSVVVARASRRVGP